jgi:hypothetical protein
MIDLHKYWEALKPVVLHPILTVYDLFRHTAIWLAIAALVEAVGGGTKRALLLFPLFAGSVLSARILIVGRTLGPAELAGADWRSLHGLSSRSAPAQGFA